MTIVNAFSVFTAFEVAGEEYIDISVFIIGALEKYINLLKLRCGIKFKSGF